MERWRAEPKQQNNSLEIQLLDLSSGCNESVDGLRNKLGSPNNPYLFPPHFLKRTLYSIGGAILEFKKDDKLIGAGFLFPRRVSDKRGFTLRFHGAQTDLQEDDIRTCLLSTQSFLKENLSEKISRI